MFRLMRTPSKEVAQAAAQAQPFFKDLHDLEPSPAPGVHKESDPQVLHKDDDSVEAAPAASKFRVAGLKINALRSVAKRLGISGKGKKHELVEKIESVEGVAAVIAEVEAGNAPVLQEEGEDGPFVGADATTHAHTTRAIDDDASSVHSYSHIESLNRPHDETVALVCSADPSSQVESTSSVADFPHNHEDQSIASPPPNEVQSIESESLQIVEENGDYSANVDPVPVTEVLPREVSETETTPSKGSFARTIASAVDILRSSSRSPQRNATQAVAASPSPKVPFESIASATVPMVVEVAQEAGIDDSATPMRDLTSVQLKRRLDNLKARFDAIAPPALKEYMLLSNIPVQRQDALIGAEDGLSNCPTSTVVLSVKKDGTITIEKRVAPIIVDRFSISSSPERPIPPVVASSPTQPAGTKSKAISRVGVTSGASNSAPFSNQRSAPVTAIATTKALSTKSLVNRSTTSHSTSGMSANTPGTAVSKRPLNRVATDAAVVSGSSSGRLAASVAAPGKSISSSSSSALGSTGIKSLSRPMKTTASSDTLSSTGGSGASIKSPMASKSPAASKRASDTARAKQQISAAQAMTAAASSGSFASVPRPAPAPSPMHSPPPSVTSSASASGTRGSLPADKKNSPPVVQPFLQLTAADRTEERKRMERLGVGLALSSKNPHIPTESTRNAGLLSKTHNPSESLSPRDRASSPHRLQSADSGPATATSSSSASSLRPSSGGRLTPAHKASGTPIANRTSVSSATAIGSASKRAALLTSPVGAARSGGLADTAKRSTPAARVGRSGASTLLSSERAAVASGAAASRSSLQSATKQASGSRPSSGSSALGAKKPLSSSTGPSAASGEQRASRPSASNGHSLSSSSSSAATKVGTKEVKISPKREAANPFSAIC